MSEKLVRIYEEKSASNRELLMQKYYSYKMERGDSIVQYTTKMQNMARALIDIGEDVSDCLLLTRITDGLPDKFENFYTAWDNVDPEKQKFDTLVERLKKEERRLAKKEEEASAYSATRNSGGERYRATNGSSSNTLGNDRRSSDVYKCFYCNRPGHIKRNCQLYKQDKGKQTEFVKDAESINAFVITATESAKCAENPVGKGGPAVEIVRRSSASCNSALMRAQTEALMNAGSADVWLTDRARHVTSLFAASGSQTFILAQAFLYTSVITAYKGRWCGHGFY